MFQNHRVRCRNRATMSPMAELTPELVRLLVAGDVDDEAARALVDWYASIARGVAAFPEAIASLGPLSLRSHVFRPIRLSFVHGPRLPLLLFRYLFPR